MRSQRGQLNKDQSVTTGKDIMQAGAWGGYGMSNQF
jgi:hypothetical protein